MINVFNILKTLHQTIKKLFTKNVKIELFIGKYHGAGINYALGINDLHLMSGIIKVNLSFYVSKYNSGHEKQLTLTDFRW